MNVLLKGRYMIAAVIAFAGLSSAIAAHQADSTLQPMPEGGYPDTECQVTNGIILRYNPDDGTTFPVICDLDFDLPPFNGFVPLEWTLPSLYEDGSYEVYFFAPESDGTMRWDEGSACGLPKLGCD